jgi:hypothetical protein
MEVKVWNDNVHPFSQKWQDKVIKIPAKGFITMEADEAHDFKCSFAPVKFDADGNPTPETYKMIRVEYPTKKVTTQSSHACHMCGYKGMNAKDLSDHAKVNHGDEELVRFDEVDLDTKTKKAK